MRTCYPLLIFLLSIYTSLSSSIAMRSFCSMRSKHGDAAAYEAVHGYAVVLVLGNFVIGAKCFFGAPPSVVFPCCAICVVMN